MTTANRFIAFAVGAALATLIVAVMSRNLGLTADLALFEGTTYLENRYEAPGAPKRINAWELDQYDELYPRESDFPAEPEGLWVGDSHLNSIAGETTDAALLSQHTTRILGAPIFALGMPSAQFDEMLVIVEWAFGRRRIDWLILPLQYSSIRRNGLRTEMGNLTADGSVTKRLAANPLSAYVGARLEELDAQEKYNPGQEPTEQSDSWQRRAEDALGSWISSVWPLWGKRDDLRSVLEIFLKRARMALLRRTMVIDRTGNDDIRARNMAAVKAILEAAQREDVKVIAYFPPQRGDVPTPYFMEGYDEWRGEIRSLVEQHSAALIDATDIIPESSWLPLRPNGTYDGSHFGPIGHQIVGERVAVEIQKHQTTNVE